MRGFLPVVVVCSLLVHLAISELTSPCPEVLRYETRTQQDKLYGTISIGTDDDLEGVWLKIFLDKKAYALGNWFSEAISKDHIEFNIRNPSYKLPAGPPVQIRFFIDHDPNDVPNIIKINLNGKVICPNSKPYHRPETPLFISAERPPLSTAHGDSHHRNKYKGETHTDSNREPTYGGGGESGENSHRRPQGGSHSNTREQDSDRRKPATATTKKATQCGTVAQRAAPLINNGQETVPGQWPWHAALYISSETELKYSCGGTLVGEQHVVTAAHCVTKPRTTKLVPKERLIIYLGKYNIIRFSTEVQDRLIDSITVHPDYNATVLFNDIAVLKLKTPVDVNNYVRPCCLWDDDTELEDLVGKRGTVVGWGFNERGQITQNMMQAEMPIVSTNTCLFSNRDFFSMFLYDKNFCAGFRNGTTVCNGDSGGGFVLPKRNTSADNVVWQLRGIVSVGVARQSTSGSVCDPKHYSIFTDAAKFIPWLKKVIAD